MGVKIGNGERSRPAISIFGLSKTYASGLQALKDIDLEIRRGEIFALLVHDQATFCGTVRCS